MIRVVVTKYHTLSGICKRSVFLTVLGAGNLRSRCRQGCLCLEKVVFSLCLHMTVALHLSEPSSPFLIRTPAMLV